jgi:hypothetical protein
MPGRTGDAEVRGELGIGEGLWEEWILEPMSWNLHLSDPRVRLYLGIAPLFYPESKCGLEILDIILRVDLQSVRLGINGTICISDPKKRVFLESLTDLQEALRSFEVRLQFSRQNLVWRIVQ